LKGKPPQVDWHIHLARYEWTTPGYDAYVRSNGVDLEDLARRYGEPEGFLELLDRTGIDYAVILAEHCPITTGRGSNDQVREFCARSGGRLIPFCSVNPYEATHPARELERLVREEGFRGLKLYPTYQLYYPNDRLVYPLYAKCEELGIPVMMHTGSSVFPGSRIKYGDPVFVDDVAVDFPGLTIVMAHGGRPFWYDRALWMARLHENVYFDLAGLPPKRVPGYFPELERVADKVLFGTDWPGVPSFEGNWAAARELPLSEAAREKILGGNAARLLGLPGRSG
jgi:predicted TIM-barrel fold metal-dependent hydrolase